MVVSALMRKSNAMLKAAGIESYVLDTQVLLSAFLNADKAFLFAFPDFKVADPDAFFDWVRRRASHEPVQYILGRCEFMSLEFRVNPGVLIPRPDTETLAELVIGFAGDKPYTMLDIGTGSGCIAISCAKSCPNVSVDAVDVSQQALDTAKDNAAALGVDRIRFIKMDILKNFPDKTYDIVVSNPPYIETAQIPGLMADVRDYEPAHALDGGGDGLAFYRRIAQYARVNRLLAFEVGQHQADAVANILCRNGYRDVRFAKDLSGIRRVVYAMV